MERITKISSCFDVPTIPLNDNVSFTFFKICAFACLTASDLFFAASAVRGGCLDANSICFFDSASALLYPLSAALIIITLDIHLIESYRFVVKVDNQ